MTDVSLSTFHDTHVGQQLVLWGSEALGLRPGSCQAVPWLSVCGRLSSTALTQCPQPTRVPVFPQILSIIQRKTTLGLQDPCILSVSVCMSQPSVP